MFSVNTLLTNWPIIRWLRLGLGVFMAVQAVQHQDALAGFISTFFLFQAVTNTGCCGSTGCAIPAASDTQSKRKPAETKTENVNSQ